MEEILFLMAYKDTPRPEHHFKSLVDPVRDSMNTATTAMLKAGRAKPKV